MDGTRMPVACLKTLVATRAMQRPPVGFGHSGACAWETLTPMHLPKHHPIPGAARHCCPVLSVPYAVTDHLISLKSGKQKGVKAALTALRDALAASPAPQPTKRVFPAPAISPPPWVAAVPGALGSFHRHSGHLGAQNLSQSDSCLPKGGGLPSLSAEALWKDGEGLWQRGHILIV